MFLPCAPADPPLGSRHFLLQPSKQQYVPFGHSSSLLQVCTSPIWHRLEIDTMGHFPVAAPWVTTRTCSNNIIKILQRSSTRSRTACKRSPIAKKIWLSIHQRKFGIHLTVRPPARRPSVRPFVLANLISRVREARASIVLNTFLYDYIVKSWWRDERSITGCFTRWQINLSAWFCSVNM